MNMSKLSKQERVVLGMVAEGMSHEEIAEEMCVVVGTVNFHMASIRKKLNAAGKNRVKVLLLAKEKGWL